MINKTRKRGGATTMGKGKGKGIRSTAGRGTRRMSPPPNRMLLPRCERSTTNSSVLFDSLNGPRNGYNRYNLKSKFNEDPIIIPALYQMLPSGEVPDEVILSLNPSPSGIYLNWVSLSDGRQLLHITIHTGRYVEGATARMVDACLVKGNMHITFDLLPHRDVVKLSVNDQMKVQHDLERLNPDDSPKHEIVARVIRIFKQYINETEFPTS
jgi:hypothetical protein